MTSELPFFEYVGVEEDCARIDAEEPESFEIRFIDRTSNDPKCDVYVAGPYDWKTRPDLLALPDGRIAFCEYEPGRERPKYVHICKPEEVRLVGQVDGKLRGSDLDEALRSLGLAPEYNPNDVEVAIRRRKEYKCPACAHEWRGHPRQETMQEVFDDDRRDEALDGDRLVVAGLLGRAIRARGLCIAKSDGGAFIRAFGVDVKSLAIDFDDRDKIPHVWQIDLRHELPRAYATLARLSALPNECGPLDTLAVLRRNLIDSLTMAANNHFLAGMVDGHVFTAGSAWKVDVGAEPVRACRALLRLAQIPRCCGPAKALAALKAE
jgi:hypothetical protein